MSPLSSRSVRSLAVCVSTLCLAIVFVYPASGSAQAGAGRATYKIVAFTQDLQRQLSATQIALLEKLNRRDHEHLMWLTEVIAPEDYQLDELAHSPFPVSWPWAERHPKVLIVDQPSQVFAAYQFGQLVRWGPTSTGRQETPTPPGFFHLTWRSKSRRSTDNREWILNWYFNFVNERGISFHEFELPGRPASHACVRLLQRDARWIYDWGVQWRLSPDKRSVAVPGTPVIIAGAYDFTKPPPWLTLAWWQRPISLPTP